MVDHNEFKAIYNEYKNLVYNLALGYVQNASDAQDITQEVFVKIFQHVHRHDPQIASLKTWIYRIAINHSLDFIKSQRTARRFGFITALFHKESNEPIVEIQSYDHPGIAMEQQEELYRLFGLINALPDNQKTVVILLKIEDRSHKEVAEIMGISVKAVESLFHRAKLALSKNIRT